MAICNLDQNKELRKTLATYLNIRIKDNLKSDKPFKFLDVMNDIFKIAYDKDQDVNKALGIAGAVPGLFEQLLKKRPEYIFSLAQKGFKIDPVIDFKKEIQSSETPLQTVGKYIRGLSMPSVAQAIKTGTDFSEGAGMTLQKEAKTTPVYSDERMMKHTFFATTIRTNLVKPDGTYEIDQKDPSKISTQNTVGNLLMKQGSNLNFENVEYQGQEGFRLRAAVESSLPNQEKNAFMQDSSRIVLAVTDNEGNFIYFDNEGNITTAENGKIAYQYLQSVDPLRVDKIKNNLLKQAAAEIQEQAAGDEVLLEKLTKEKKRIIDRLVDDEVNIIQDIKAKVNTNEKVLLNITGGEVGFIDDRNTSVTLGNMIEKGGLNNEEIASIGAVFAKGPNGFDNPTIKFRNYPQRITLKGVKIGEANPELVDKLVNLFVDDLVDIDDNVVAPQDKINLAKQYLEIRTEDKKKQANKLFLAPAGNNKLSIYLGNNLLSLDDKAAAKQQLKEFINKNGYHTFIKKPGDSYTNFNIDGNVLKENIQSGYKRYIAQYLIPRIMVDQNTGTAMVNNGYFTFSPTNLAETVAQEVKQTVAKAKEITEKPENKPLPDQNDPLPDLFERSKLIKSRANRIQKAAADKWLKESGLLKVKINGKPVITADRLLDITNSDAFATFGKATMTLYKGGDSTHMYHEAWHAFSQMFLTKPERDELYKNASKLDGTVTYIKKISGPGGNTNKSVTVKLNTLNPNIKADRRILEEFIAEEFRVYAMNNGKFKTKDTKASLFEKIFKRIWEFLKALFKGTLPVNVYSNPGSNVFADMFNKLYTAKTDKDLSMYSPSIKNSEQFGTLNTGIVDLLSELDLELVSKSIDGVISETITNYILGIGTKEGRKSPGAAMLIFNPKNLPSLYNVTIKGAFEKRLRELEKNYEASKDKLTQTENDAAVNNIKILQRALDNFGDINDILKSKNPKNSVVAYHLRNSAFAGRIKESQLDPTDRDSSWRELLSGNDKSPNDFETEELATANAKYIIGSLIQQEYNANKTAVVNKLNSLGFPQTIEFKPFWNLLMSKVGGQQNEEDLYNELVKVKDKKITPLFAQLLDKIGNPSEVMSKSKVATDLWLGLVRSLNPYRTDFHNNIYDITVIEPEEEGGETKEVITATSGKVSADYFTIRNNVWKTKFNLDVGPYVKLNNITQQNELNLAAIANDFLTDPTNPKQRALNKNLFLEYRLKSPEQSIAFLNAIGLYMSNDDLIKNKINPAAVDSIANAIGYAYYNNKSIPDPQAFLTKDQVLKGRKLQGDQIIEVPGYKLKSNATNVNTLATLEAEFSTDYSSQMKSLPSGDTKSIYSFNSTVTRILDPINKVDNIEELGNPKNKYGIVPQLIYKKNPKVMGSIYVNSLFSDGVKQEGREMEIRQLVGAQVRTSDGSVEGVSPGDMSRNEKFVSDVLSMLQTGFIEAVRNGEKSTYSGIRPNKIETDPSYDKKSNHLSFDTEDFLMDVNGLSITGVNVNSILNRVMHKKLEGELRVIQKLKQGISKAEAEELGIDPKDAKDFYKNNVKNFSNGFKFDWFEEVLESIVDGSSLKEQLINEYADKVSPDSNTSLVDLLISTDEGKALKKKIDTQIQAYFSNVANRFKNIYTKIYGNTIPDFLKNLTTGKLTDVQKRDVTDQNAINALMMSFAVNTSLHTDEVLLMVFGDGFQFNHNKDEGLKRVPTYHSPGIVFSTGNNSVEAINNFYPREYERKLIADGVITSRNAPREFSRIGEKAIIRDPEVATLQYDSYNELFLNILSKRNYSEEEIKNLMYGDGDKAKPGKGSIMHTWKYITMADGQGYVSFDYYRMLKADENSWTNAQEIIYQKEIRGEYISAEEIFDAFPVYKLQYAGALALPGDMYPIQSIDKFSLLPLIPSLIKNTPLDTIHKEMINQGVDYILFDSAAKRSYIKAGESNGDHIFEGNSTSKLKPGFKFTKNPFFVDFLKNQTEVNKSAKNKATLSTQFRKIFDTGLYEQGLPVDYTGTKEQWDKLTHEQKEKESKAYKNSEKVLHELGRLTSYMRKQLLKEMGWKEVNGKLMTVKGTQDLTTMLTYIKKKLKDQGYSQNDIDSIETDDGKIDLSTEPIAPRLERFLFSIINNKLVKLKILGEPLVQVSSAFFGFTNATKEQLAQYGDDDFGLSGYVVDPNGKENTKGVKVKLALTKNYQNLYQTFYFAQNEKGVYENTGETIAVYNEDGTINNEESFKRLNQMLKVNEWLENDNNRAKIQITGVRIPVQGPNSTEFAEIFEFLPPSAGTIIIIPRDIVAKSGGDFDVDKLTMYIKHITKQGSILFDTVNEPKDLDARIKELEKKLGLNGKKLNINNYLDDFRSEINDIKEHIELSKEQIDAFTSQDNKALLETLSDKENQKYLAEVAPEAYEIYSKNIKSFDIEEYDKIQKAIVDLRNKNTEIAKDYNELSDLKEHKRNFSAAIQNSMLDGLIKVLEMPQMAFSLLLPNGTYLAKPQADDLKKIISKLDNEVDYNKSINTGQQIKGRETGVNPGVLRDYSYNLDKQQAFAAGKGILGPIVLEIPISAQLNKAGALLNANVEETILVKKPGSKEKEKVKVTTPITLELKHNYVEGLVAAKKIRRISMSNILDADKKNQIADVLSQLTNGAVDVGKDAWIAYLQGNLEAIPKLLFLLETGVPATHVFYFINNPFIREYVALKQKAGSKLAKLFYGFNHDKRAVIDEYTDKKLSGIKNVDQDAYKHYDTLWGKHTLMKKFIQSTGVADAFELDNLKKIAKGEGTQDQIMAGFLQYLYVEKLTSQHDDLKMALDVDNNTTGDNAEIQAKIEQVKDIENLDIYDEKTIDYLVNKSIISSFFIQNLASDLFGERLFSFRANKAINKFIRESLKDFGKRSKIKEIGLNRETFPGKFKNALTLHIFTTALNKINLKQVLKDGYNGYSVTELLEGTKVGSLEQVIDDYKNNNYLVSNKTDQSYVKRGLYPINPSYFAGYTENDFIKFTLEREYLRKVIMPFTPLLKESKEYNSLMKRFNKQVEQDLQVNNWANLSMEDKDTIVYEYMLLHQALLNTYNNKELFQSGENTVAKKLMDVIRDYPELGIKYGNFINRLALDYVPSPDGFSNPRRNFKLKSNVDISDAEVADYLKSWKELADPSKHKLDKSEPKDLEANKYISDFFAKLPLYSFLQTGLDPSQFSMNNVMPRDAFKGVMERGMADFKKDILSNNDNVINNVLNRMFNLFLEKNAKSEQVFRGRGINYKKELYEKVEELPEVKPAVEKEPIISYEQREEFKAAVEKNQGVLPKVHFTSPDSKWILNTNNLYDLVDQNTGQMYLRDVNLETGYQQIPGKPIEIDEPINDIVRASKPNLLKNDNGLIIAENVIPKEETIRIVDQAKDFIKETNFKQTGGAVSWAYGMQWMRINAMSPKQREGLVIGEQLNGLKITQAMKDKFISTGDSKGFPLYGYTTFDKNGKKLPSIPQDIINYLSSIGIDVSQYDASYNSVYDKIDNGNLIIHQDNSETNKSPIITISLGRPMKFITYELNDPNDFSVADSNNTAFRMAVNAVSGEALKLNLIPQYAIDKKGKIKYGHLTPDTLLKYAEQIDKIQGSQLKQLVIDKLKEQFKNAEKTEYNLKNGAVLVFSGNNRNVFHEIVFDKETNKKPMESGFPTLTINKAFKGLGEADRIVDTKDYRVVLTLRKVEGPTLTDVVDEQKLIGTVTQQPAPAIAAPAVQTPAEIKKPTPVFNTLPGKSATPTMTYAGIGSRETPQDVLDIMTKAATYLESLGYTLRSGGAAGADTAFEKGVKSKKQIFGGFEETGEKEKKVAHEIHPDLKGTMNRSKNRKIKEKLAEGATQKQAEKSGERSAWAVENLMARNTNQVFGENLDTPVDFVLAYDKSGWAGAGDRPSKGGTLQAIDMAYRKGIPVINMANDNWREQLKEVLKNKPAIQSTSEIKGIEINSKQKGLGNDLTNVHYARNGKSAFDIVPTDKSLKLTPEAKKTWGESTEAWYQSNKAQTKGIPEGPEEDAYDMKLMIGLITDKLKQYSNLVNEINERGGQAFLDKSTHTMGNGRWSSNNPKNMFMNALKQAYQNVTTQPAAEVKIEPTDKIIWGHPGLGKTFLRESRQDIIDFDSDYKPEINKKYNLEPGYKARNEWRKTHENEWNQMVRELWREAKQEAKKTGKTLLASDMIFLREFASDIDKIITMSTPTFIERSKQRDDYKKGDTEDWKNKIDIEISKMPSQKVITTDKYLSDLLPKAQTTEINLTPEQIKLAKEKKIEQNFYDKKPYAREKDSTGKVTKWDVYKSKNGKSSMQAALDGDRTQSTRSVSEIQKLEELAKSQGITSGIKGTIVWMEGQVDNVKDSKNIKGDWFRITSEPYTPNKKDFDAYENWDPSVWENRSSEFKMGEKGEWKSIRFERVKSAQPTTQPSTLPGPETKINIYAGTGENAELSNFAVRPFREYPESTGSPSPIFKTVEGAYQATKLHHTDKEAGYLVKDAGYIKLTPKGEELTKKLQEATGAEAERLGRSITGLKTDIWDFQSHIYMKRLIKKSFEQNPDALAKLLATGNATLTHTQDKGKWRTEFPRLLMEVRDELRAAQPSPQPAATAPEKTTKPEPSGKVNLGDSQYSNKDLPDDLDIIDSKIFTDYFGYDEKTKAWTPMQGTVIGYRAIQDGYGSPAISLKVKLDNDRIYTTIMHYGRYWEKFGWNVDDRLKAGYDKYVQLLKNKPAEKPVAEPLPNDKYQYYGAMYEIVRDSNGVGIDVVGYQGKAAKKEALLTAYNNNPNIDPQNDKPFREVEGPKSEQKAFDTPAPDNNLPVFTYEGKTITTDFQLTDQQDNALKQLIDFVENDTEKVITLSGYAGTGKTSMIKYLEKFLPKSNYKFIYSAPTHAATVYLALSTGVFPFTVPQLIRGKYNPKTNQTEYAPSKKFEEALSIHKDNILVIDEASMIGNKEISQLLAGIPEGVKVIFMGDEAQIPEVGMRGQTKKNISKVFTDFRNIQLTDVKRTNDNGILKVLTEIRNNPDGVLPVVPDTETLKYYDNAVTFKKAAFNAIKENPEGAVYISYVNSDVKDFNRQVREGLGYEGDLKEGEVITGYAGYNSKTVLDKNLGNSIKYTVDKVTVSPKGKEGEVIIDFSSKLLEKIPYLVEKKATKGTTRYLQLSPNDALIFEGITDEQMLENNRKVAEIIEEVYDAKVDALRRPAAWRRFYDVVYEAGKKLAKMDLGNQYIYNPSTRLMELYIGSPKQLEILGPKGDFKELLIDRGIDYGYGITIHKSQGATYENVFYNGSSVNNQTPLIKNNVQVGTEGNSLNYVGMSRASKTLSVLKGQYTKDLSKPKPQVEVAKQPVKPTVTSAATTPIAPTPATRPAVTPEAASKLDKRKKIILRSWQDAKMAIILAEKGYDINDFIAKLGAAQTDAEINEIINKLNRLLC